MLMSEPVRALGIRSGLGNRTRDDALETESASDSSVLWLPDLTGRSSASAPAPPAVSSARRPKRPLADAPWGTGSGICGSVMVLAERGAAPTGIRRSRARQLIYRCSYCLRL